VRTLIHTVDTAFRVSIVHTLYHEHASKDMVIKILYRAQYTKERIDTRTVPSTVQMWEFAIPPFFCYATYVLRQNGESLYVI